MTSIMHRRVMQEGLGTVTFWWKVSSEANYDWLPFCAHGVLQDRISGEVGWQQITYTYDPSGRRIAKLVSPPGGGVVDGAVTKTAGGPRPTRHVANLPRWQHGTEIELERHDGRLENRKKPGELLDGCLADEEEILEIQRFLGA